MSKRGRLNHAEMTQIEVMTEEGKSIQEISLATDRSQEIVLRFIKENLRPKKTSIAKEEAEVDEADKIVIRQELRSSETWKALKEEFTPDEIKFFEESYINMMSQMRENIMPTEEVQIFHAVKYQLLMSRNLRERKKCREDIDRIERIQEDFIDKFEGDASRMTDSEKEFSLNLDTQLNVARASEQSRTNEYVKLEDRHGDLMKSLKSTRDQRIKQLDTLSEGGFIPVIKLLAARDEQERQGRQIELVKMSGKKEYIRLGRPHLFDDGNMDNPILSEDTVDLGPEGSEVVQEQEAE